MAEKPKRQLILEAAFEIFSTKGFHATKVEEIADKAGVGKGTIYEYFSSKAHVFQEMYKWYVERYFAEIEEGIEAMDNAEQKLYLIVKNHVTFVSTLQSLAGKMLSESTSHLDLDLEFKETMLATYKEKIKKVIVVLDEGVTRGHFRPMDTEMLGLFFYGSLSGITHSMFLFQKNISPEELAEKFVHLLMNGIKK